MRIRGISVDLIRLLLQIGRENHPYEFVAVLREEDGIIRELNLLPGTSATEVSAHLLYDMMPLDTHVAGSAHSHPSGGIFPSEADLSFFPRIGRYHVIVGFPYGENDWRCFLTDGSPASLEVVA